MSEIDVDIPVGDEAEFFWRKFMDDSKDKDEIRHASVHVQYDLAVWRSRRWISKNFDGVTLFKNDAHKKFAH